MNAHITPAQRNEMINKMITDINNHIALINDMPDDGFVFMFDNGVCVNCDAARDGHLSFSILAATVITQAELDACEKYGVGFPAYQNGKGEFPKLTRVRDAKFRAICDLNMTLETINNVLV